jgi:hypothetical protein
LFRLSSPLVLLKIWKIQIHSFRVLGQSRKPLRGHHRGHVGGRGNGRGRLKWRGGKSYSGGQVPPLLIIKSDQYRIFSIVIL